MWTCRPFHYYVYQNNKLDRALEFKHFCQRIDGTYWQMDTAEQARIIVEFKIIEPNIQIQNLIHRDAAQEMENILKISYAEIDTLSNNRILGSTKLKNGMIPNDKISETYFSEGVVNSQLLWNEGVYQRIYYYPNGNIKAKVDVEPYLWRSEFITFDPITFAEIIEYKSDFVPVREGDYQSFYENGKPKTIGIYRKGYKIGKWKEYSFDSVLMVDALYDTSALGEIVFYYSNGEIQAKGKAYAMFLYPSSFLGKANYVNHSGSKPMNITWQLEEPLPPYIWKESAKMAVGCDHRPLIIYDSSCIIYH